MSFLKPVFLDIAGSDEIILPSLSGIENGEPSIVPLVIAVAVVAVAVFFIVRAIIKKNK